ncbi:MAG: hypothetical protein ACRDSZ_04585 [Pseudonocardiaceae bacterium]
MTEQLFVPPATAKSRLRRKRKWIGLVIAVLVLAAGLGWGGYQVFHACGWLGSGVYRVDGECVGVTDGSYLFDPAFEQVQKKIADENAWVRAQPVYVTVALLNPLTATPTSALSTEEILEQLEGAYTAQYQANHTSAVGDSGPPVQLVLANEGSTEDQWQPVVDQLVEMAGQEDNPLVAVVGLGLSIAQTKQGAQELSRHGIPMVGAIIAADGFDHNQIPGLIRVSPTSQDYARSLRGHLDSRDDLRSAILVSDSNSDSNSDLFTRTLRDAFRENMADLIKFPDQIFTGGGFPTNASPGVFATITPNICAAAAQGLEVILYAGRRGDLDGFLEALENRVCQNTPLTVMTAGIKYDVYSGREQQLRAKNLTVVFSARTDARGWGANVPGTPGGYPAFLQAFTEAGFNLGHLEDDRAILTHDAVLTAAKAVRLAAPGASPPGAPTARDVVGQLLNLNSLNSVPAAGGTLSFSFRGPGTGNPQNKPILVFEFPSSTPNLPHQVGPTYLTP